MPHEVEAALGGRDDDRAGPDVRPDPVRTDGIGPAREHEPAADRERDNQAAKLRYAERRGTPAPLLEPLSDRELAVLRYLPTMMSNAEIAAEMFVSVNTVKTHLKHVYRKLDVTDRRDCVRRGRELRLLSPGIGEG